jgi:SpoVK/Ycf46/Vps4 family AAA+-type ATPase
VIDEYLRDEIEVHLIGNLVMKPAPGPLILGIFGPPGEGKTHHCEEVSHHLGVRLLRIGPGELESEHAGHPAQVIRREYVRAGALEEPSALIINDVDTVLGDWGPLVQYTVNRQVVVSQLMNLCDYPTEVSGNNTARVPIIVTGNNPSSMHGPLMRRGRVRVVAYEPTQEQRVAVVSTLFPWLEQRDVEEFVRRSTRRASLVLGRTPRQSCPRVARRCHQGVSATSTAHCPCFPATYGGQLCQTESV